MRSFSNLLLSDEPAWSESIRDPDTWACSERAGFVDGPGEFRTDTVKFPPKVPPVLRWSRSRVMGVFIDVFETDQPSVASRPDDWRSVGPEPVEHRLGGVQHDLQVPPE
jgi:hypothetical protein